jgi:hypothetical protein
MIPFILAAIGGYLIGDSFGEEIDSKFEDGGVMAKGGELVPYILWVSTDGEKRQMYGTYKSQRAAEMAMKKLWNTGDYKEMGNKPKSKYEKEGFYEDGGELPIKNSKLVGKRVTIQLPTSVKPFKDTVLHEYKDTIWCKKGVYSKKYIVTKMERGGESHSDQMIDIINNDREQMGRRMRIQASTLEEDMKEAKEIFGKYWDTLSQEEKIEATKYLKLKGDVGHFGQEDDDVQSFMYDLNYRKGGRTNGKK